MSEDERLARWARQAPGTRALVAALALLAFAAPGRPAHAQDSSLYAGPVCYRPSPLDPGRCYLAQGVLSDGKLTGQWRGRQPVATVYLAGEISSCGAARIELRSEDADGTRLVTINLAGELRDGHLTASGSVDGSGRSITIEWDRK